MPSPRFDQSRPFLILAFLGLIWLLVPTAAKRLLRLSFYELQTPVALTTSHLRDLQDYWSLRTRSKNDLIQAGREVANRNASYEVAIRQNESLRLEIERLEALLRLPSYPEFRSEPARVIRRDFTAWWQRLTIRKGRNAGLIPGSPVIFAGGVVGRVTEVHAFTAEVDLISSPALRLAAVFEGDSRPVSYQGEVNHPFTPASGTLEFVPLDLFASSHETRRLLTSGLGGVFPPGLVIGRVVSLDPSIDGLFKSGRVALDPRLHHINEVTVLVPLEPPPSP